MSSGVRHSWMFTAPRLCGCCKQTRGRIGGAYVDRGLRREWYCAACIGKRAA